MNKPLIVFLTGVILLTGALTAMLMQHPDPESLGQPDLPTPANAQTMRDIADAPNGMTPLDWERLTQAAGGSDPVSLNNYAVSLTRERRKGNRQKAMFLFEHAADSGLIAARYNLALYLPHKFDTDPAIIRRQIDLLQANVAQGDVHSMVLLARRLYFVNRADYVSDRPALIRELLARAAATGDSDYQIIYAKRLWDQVRGGADPMLLVPALQTLKQALPSQDARAAQTIAAILSNGNPAYENAIIQADLPHRDALEWLEQAGDQGAITARCSYGLQVFRAQRWLELDDTSFKLIKAHFSSAQTVYGNRPEVLERAISDLQHCAQATRLKWPPNPPFGSPALYRSKQKGSRISLANSPGHAHLTLGVLHGFGILLPRDRQKADFHLQQAFENHDISQANGLKNSLPDF